MANSGIMDQASLVLKKSLDLRLRNQQIIAANVANAQTPGYQARRFQRCCHHPSTAYIQPWWFHWQRDGNYSRGAR